MSGGSMDYLSHRVEDATFRENTPERRAFRKHLDLVAAALHEIEWADSGDTTPGDRDTAAIRACLHDGAIAETIIAELRELVDAAQREAQRLEGE